MTDDLKLLILKKDLQIMTDKLDDYLMTLLSASRSFISREGVTLTDTQEDGILEEMYAAYLYRKRREAETPMPVMLRYALNNRIFSEKAGGAGG